MTRPRQIHVLLLSESESMAALDRRALREVGVDRIEGLTSGVAAARMLAGLDEFPPSFKPDVVICSQRLSDMDGEQFCAILRLHPLLLDMPILLILPHDSEVEQLRTLGLGLEERMSSKVGLLSGGQRQALTLLMAALRTPKLLLLDEHTAALDPKTAAKVLELTEKIVAEQKLTAMMVTHNMKDAIAMGNRLIMMNAGRIVVDVRGEEKKKLTREDLMQLFEKAAGQEIENDRMLLS